MRGSTVLKIGAVLVVGAVVAAAAMIATLDANQYKGVIIAKAKELTGRDLVIDGDLEMVIGLTPSVQVKGVTFGNAPWASDPNMIAVENFEAQVALLPALRGDIQVQRLVLDGAAIFLETDAKGRTNWTFPQQPADPAAPKEAEGELRLPSLEEVRIKNARLVIKEDGNVLTTLSVAQLDLSAEAYDEPLALTLVGSYNAVPFDVQGVLGPLSRLTGTGGAPYPVALKGTVGGVAVMADGGVAEPFAGRGIDMAVSVQATELAGLAPLVGDLPTLPPLDLKGRVKGGGTAWALSDMTLKAGRSTAAGAVNVALGGAVPDITASIQAALIDLGELQGQSPETTAPATPATATPRDRVFSSDPLPLEDLKAVNAAFDVEIARLVLPDGVVLEGLGARGALKGGRLALNPVQARLGGGIVKGTIAADASSGKSLDIKADVSGDKVVLGTLFADMARSDLLTDAPTDAQVNLSAAGTSMAGLMGSLDGTVRISVGPGRVNQAVIDWAGGDVLNQLSETLNPMAEKREYADLVCAAVNLRARRGVIEYDRAIAMETTRMSVVSSGTVDLGAEKIDVAVRPYPKGGVGISAGKLAEMVRLQGSLAQPKVAPDVIGVAKTAASVLGALATGGASLVAEGLMGHASADTQPCVTALGGPGKAAAPTQDPATPATASSNPIQDLGKGLNQLFGR
ncbi:MAG: AsmA family protein [Rhodospirillaceae bacterium]